MMGIGRSRRHAGAAAIVALGLLATGPAFSQSPAACASTKAELKRIDDAIAQLDQAALPGKLASDLIDVLDQLIDGLKNTKSDLANITGSPLAKKEKESLSESPRLWRSEARRSIKLGHLTSSNDGVSQPESKTASRNSTLREPAGLPTVSGKPRTMSATRLIGCKTSATRSMWSRR